MLKAQIGEKSKVPSDQFGFDSRLSFMNRKNTTSIIGRKQRGGQRE